MQTLGIMRRLQQPSLGGFDVGAVLIFLSICLMAPTDGFGSFGLVLSFLWLLFREKDLRAVWWQSMRALLGIAALYLIIQSVFSFSLSHGLKLSWSTLRGLAYSFLAVYLTQQSSKTLRDAGFLSVLVLLCAALGLVVFNVCVYGWPHILAGQGLESAVNRNMTAVGLALAYLLAVVFFVGTPCIKRRVFFVLSAAILFFISYLNNSRGAMVGMLAATWAVGMMWRWRLTVCCSALVAGILCALWQSGFFAAHLTHGPELGNGRAAIWAAVFERVLEQPWQGYGLRALPNDAVYHARYPSLLNTSPHSIYLELLYSAGVVGVLLWLAWFAQFARVMREKFSTQEKITPYLGAALLVYVLVHGLVDLSVYGVLVPLLLAMGSVLWVIPVREINAASRVAEKITERARHE